MKFTNRTTHDKSTDLLVDYKISECFQSLNHEESSRTDSSEVVLLRSIHRRCQTHTLKVCSSLFAQNNEHARVVFKHNSSYSPSVAKDLRFSVISHEHNNKKNKNPMYI